MKKKFFRLSLALIKILIFRIFEKINTKINTFFKLNKYFRQSQKQILNRLIYCFDIILIISVFLKFIINEIDSNVFQKNLQRQL